MVFPWLIFVTLFRCRIFVTLHGFEVQWRAQRLGCHHQGGFFLDQYPMGWWDDQLPKRASMVYRHELIYCSILMYIVVLQILDWSRNLWSAISGVSSGITGCTVVYCWWGDFLLTKMGGRKAGQHRSTLPAPIILEGLGSSGFIHQEIVMFTHHYHPTIDTTIGNWCFIASMIDTNHLSSRIYRSRAYHNRSVAYYETYKSYTTDGNFRILRPCLLDIFPRIGLMVGTSNQSVPESWPVKQ